MNILHFFATTNCLSKLFSSTYILYYCVFRLENSVALPADANDQFLFDSNAKHKASLTEAALTLTPSLLSLTVAEGIHFIEAITLEMKMCGIPVVTPFDIFEALFFPNKENQ